MNHLNSNSSTSDSQTNPILQTSLQNRDSDGTTSRLPRWDASSWTRGKPGCAMLIHPKPMMDTLMKSKQLRYSLDFWQILPATLTQEPLIRQESGGGPVDLPKRSKKYFSHLSCPLPRFLAASLTAPGLVFGSWDFRKRLNQSMPQKKPAEVKLI